MADRGSVERAVDDARRWVTGLGPHWVAMFDQMHGDVRTWAEQVGVDPRSYEFQAAWCVATTFLHRMARLLEPDESPDPEDVAWLANVLATVGLWGCPGGLDIPDSLDIPDGLGIPDSLDIPDISGGPDPSER